jgi:hypothetical protein
MRWCAGPLCAGWLLLGLAGCGSPDGVTVTGRVTLDGRPLPNAEVTFHPLGDTKGLGGSAVTDADGRYELVSARVNKGVAPGEYRVVVSRRLRPDGSPPDPNVPPIESDARETLPAAYSRLDASTLTARVSREKPAHDFALTAAKK